MGFLSPDVSLTEVDFKGIVHLPIDIADIFK